MNKDFVAAVAIRPFPREEKRERTPGAAARRVTRGLRRLAFRTGVRGTRQLSTGSSDTRTVTQHKNQNKKQKQNTNARSFEKKGRPSIDSQERGNKLITSPFYGNNWKSLRFRVHVRRRTARTPDITQDRPIIAHHLIAAMHLLNGEDFFLVL